MAKFCGKCGAKLDEATGLCPNCDADKLNKQTETPEAVEKPKPKQDTASEPKKPLSKKEAKKKRKADKKAAKKAKKKEKRKQWSMGKKIFRFILKIILIVFLLLILAIGVMGALVYFEIVDVPGISYILERSGIQKVQNVSIDPMKDSYVPDEDSILYDENTNQFYANNEIIVMFSYNATEIQKEAVIDFLNGELVGTVPELNMYQIMIQDCDALEELISIANEITDNFDYVIYATYDSATVNQGDAYSPNDPWNGDVGKDDWGDETIDGSNWWIEAINAQYAWDYKDSFSNIVIGICDSSFDTGHEDLKNKVSFPNDILESRNVVTPWWYDFNNLKHLKSWSVSEQENYHGTHVAGIIGAEGDNKKGITGIVQNCSMLLAPYYRSENMDAYLAWDSSTYANLSYLVKAGAKVINFSQGKTNFLQESTNNIAYGKEIIEREGHLAAVSLSQLIALGYDDFIVVQSAGNGTGDTGKALDALQNGWFASITDGSITGYENISIQDVQSHVIIVGAAEQTTSGFQTASFSNYGTQVDICAPGVRIYSTIPGEVFYDFQFFGGYGFANGTSMSAPIVTGVCALTWSANTNLSAGEVKNIVCNNASVVVGANPETDDETTYNMVDAKLSVEAALNYSEEIHLGQFEQSSVPTDAVEFNGHWYKVIQDNSISDWNAASQYCNAQNGYLATITSAEENDFLYSYITQEGYSSAYFGLSDAASEGNWTWNNGEKVSYTNWHRNEPNSENSNEDYALFYYKYSDGTWNDGDFGNRTVSGGTAFICEWGEYTVASETAPAQEPIRTTSDERDIVLVLDVSGSMSGTPMQETKKASANFIDTILDEDASIGIVTYDDSSYMLSDFSVNKSSLTNAVSNIYDGGGTNIEAGLAEARSMLNTSGAKKKIIVLMSDGEPNRGKEGDALISYADEIKDDGIIIYTLGFFESLGSYKSSAQILMEGIASDGCHYEVASADDLVFFFEDMADQINGQKYIYIRIACPVDVAVTHNGETLSSAEDDFNVRTDFGTLTFEDNEDVTNANEDDRIKVLRLKEGAEYDVKIIGTGHGLMDYTIGFMDENGDYSDFRRFENIKITRRTEIDTIAAVSKESVLNIDEDGDGKYDLKLRAEENGYGEEVEESILIYIVAVSGAVLLLLIVILIVRKNRKNKKSKENN
ncbi:MAG: S8 family serine peptidase [Candidatus Fimisoma sp.]